METTKIWKAQNDKLLPLEEGKLDAEKLLEAWLENDISILGDDILLVGRQVPTEFTGEIDLLGIYTNGDLVVIELKREKTHRQVVAQGIDYAACIEDWSRERVLAAATKLYPEEGSFEKAFCQKFNVQQLPEDINGQQHILVVATRIDYATERIINYLVEKYGVRINVATFQILNSGEKDQFLVRHFIVSPERMEDLTSGPKRAPNPSYEEFSAMADELGLGDVYKTLFDWASRNLAAPGKGRYSVGFSRKMEGSSNAVLTIYPGKGSSSFERGLKVQVFTERLAKSMGVDFSDLEKSLPGGKTEPQDDKYGYGKNHISYFKTKEEVDSFLARLKTKSDDGGNNAP